MRSLADATRLITAAGLSSYGDGLQLVAFPLLAASLTTDPTIIAALAAVGSLPSLVGALPVGAIVDKVRRARLMVAVDTIRAASLALLVLAVLSGHPAIWPLFVLALLLGAGELIFNISSAALVPTIIAPPARAKFNGYLASAQELGNGLIGPACAGFLFAASKAIPFAVNGATFLISVLLITSLARRERRTRPYCNCSRRPERMQG